MIATAAIVTTDPKQALAVNAIDSASLFDALRQGWRDFTDRPSHLLMLCIIYPAIGLLMVQVSVGGNVLPLVYPMVMGFALVGPLVAVGLYGMSRRREQGAETGWADAFAVLRSPSIGDIAALSCIVLVIYVAWLATAQALYNATFDAAPQTSMASFFSTVFTTPAGLILILAGNAIGFVFALVAFTLSVVSFPLLVDRPVGLSVAIRTSIRAVQANPRVMLAWGAIVVAALAIGFIPFMLGLAVVMPVMGHASWHLYRKLVPQVP